MSVTEILESIETLTDSERSQVLGVLQKQPLLSANQSNGVNQDKPFRTIFDGCPKLIGKHNSGLSDLSTNKEYLKDLGKKSAEKAAEKAALAERLKRE